MRWVRCSQRSSYFLHLNPQGVMAGGSKRKGKEATSSSRAKRYRTSQIVESSDTDDEIRVMEEGFVEEPDVDGLPKWVKPRRMDVYLEERTWGQPSCNNTSHKEGQWEGNGDVFHHVEKISKVCTGTINGSPYHYPTDVVLTVEKANEEAWKARVQELFVVPPRIDGGVPRQERGNKTRHNPYKMSLLVRASEWKYELRKKVHQLIDEQSRRYLEASRADVDENVSDSDKEAEYVPWTLEPVITGFDTQIQGSPYHSYIRDQMMQSRPDTFVNWPEENQLLYDRQSHEIVEGRLHRRAMMHQQELFRNQDFMYHEQIRHEWYYERGHAYTVRPRREKWADPMHLPYLVT
ncbi:hypothetical protein L1987_60021 [Smallanthus sonchifolius]|uniref:Uncharacterized protein n=1 Tax=Smallanthus sonchifolius TaxID=185202 RepID=A0ACB9D792_9ASTR|nr:hypothetical protein L1987_60021 [Smallanthus sonchifolius]